MQVLIRAPLAAAAATAMGTGLLLSGAAPRVLLTGLENPFQQVVASGELAQRYLLADYFNGADSPTPGAGEANWSYAGFDQTGGDALNYLFHNQVQLGNFNSVGLLPQKTRAGLPVIEQVALNAYGYTDTVLRGLAGAATALSVGLWELPSAISDATRLVIDGQVGQAWALLREAVSAPIAMAAGVFGAAAREILTTAAARIVAVVEAVPEILRTFVAAGTGGVVLVAREAGRVLTEIGTSLSEGDAEGSWNAGVAGLLGPAGLPGTVLNLTVGAGVQTGPIIDPAKDIPANFTPSLRTAVQAGVWTLQRALATIPPPAAAVARSDAGGRASAPAAREEDSARPMPHSRSLTLGRATVRTSTAAARSSARGNTDR